MSSAQGKSNAHGDASPIASITRDIVDSGEITIPLSESGKHIVVHVKSAQIDCAEFMDKNVSKPFLLFLGWGQVFCFVLAWILQIIAFHPGRPSYADVGSGLWAGLFFGVSGIIGIFTVYKLTKPAVVALMVTNILSALMCIPFVLYTSLALNDYRRHEGFFPTRQTWMQFTGNTRGAGNSPENDVETGIPGVAQDKCIVFLIAICVVEAVLAIVSAAIGCRAVCCRCQDSRRILVRGEERNPKDEKSFSMAAPSAPPGGFPVLPPRNDSAKAENVYHCI